MMLLLQINHLRRRYGLSQAQAALVAHLFYGGVQ